MDNSFMLSFRNPYLIPAITAWASAQVIKGLLNLLLKHKLNAERFIGTGGMPSSHSAFVMALATACGLSYGFDSVYFAIAAVLAIVVMYDATGIRRAAGRQAQKINNIIKHLLEDKDSDFSDTGKQLRELLGHSPIEVFAGGCLGVLVAVLFAL